MNISAENYEDLATEFSGETEFEKRTAAKSKSNSGNRAGFGRRRGKCPQQFNGIHRRRKKKIRW